VAKLTRDKLSIGGRKWPSRRRDADGVAEAEVVRIGGPPPDDSARERELLVPLMRKGERLHDEPLETARDRHRRAVAELPLDARHLSRGEPAIPTEYVTVSDATSD
jgi:nicotinate phosphoribosyltransferase